VPASIAIGAPPLVLESSGLDAQMGSDMLEEWRLRTSARENNWLMIESNALQVEGTFLGI
jgi:hypothetical protein